MTLTLTGTAKGGGVSQRIMTVTCGLNRQLSKKSRDQRGQIPRYGMTKAKDDVVFNLLNQWGRGFHVSQFISAKSPLQPHYNGLADRVQWFCRHH
jgi:hypothetical protein